MLGVIIRWSIPLLALFVLGPLAGMLTFRLRSSDGAAEASLLIGASPMSGLIALLASSMIALAVGIVGARVVHPRSGLFAAGLVYLWAAAGLGHADRILSAAAASGSTASTTASSAVGVPFMTLAMEGVVVTLVGAIVAWIILHIKSRPPAAVSAISQHEHPEVRGLGVQDGELQRVLSGALAATFVAAIVGILIAREPSKIQTFAAAALAGLFAAATGRVIAQSASAMFFIAAVSLLGAIGPFVASMLEGSGASALRAAFSGRLLALATPLPMDWLAGAFVGVPLGLGWAYSMIHKDAQKDHAAAHARAT
jgi:hypothetical protein